MKFRREDSNMMDLSGTVTKGSNGNVTATMTSIPKAGIGAEDLLGAVIKLVESDTGATIYATLTSSVETTENDGGASVRIVSGSANLEGIGGLGTLTLQHNETNGVVTETLTIASNT